jgi:outer membrane receptor protein involved in Fe transport
MISSDHSLPLPVRGSAGQFLVRFTFAAAGGFLALLGSTTSALAAEAGSRPMVEEILVTARKREERLIDTPVAVSALSEEGIERYNTRDIDQLTSRIPGVQIGHAAGGGAGGSMFIRGVGNLAVDYGADQPVSLVMDGMSFSRGHILDTGFFDLAAVEVLKGPQALYFGKNSPAGVIAVTSITPEVGAEMEGFVRAAYEFKTEDPVVEAGLSFPIGDHLAFRLAGRYQDMQGGYLKNTAQPFNPNPTEASGDPTRGRSYDDYPEQEQTIVRLTSVWEPVENFDATLKVFYSKSEQNDAGRTVLYACADGPGANPYYNGGIQLPDTSQICPDSKPELKRNGALPPASVANAHPFIDAGDDFFNKLNNKFQTLDMNWEIGDFTLTSVTGHWKYRHREYTNYDYTSWAIVVSKQGESGKSWTEELRLQSNFDGPLNFMVGGFYEDSERDLVAPVQILPNVLFAGIPGFIPNGDPDSFYFGSSINYHQEWDNNIKSWAGFGSVQYDFNEQWAVEAGARYTKEKRDSEGGNLYERGLGFSPGGVFYKPKDESSNTNPEVTVSWKPTDETLVYAAYKTGFQSFGISNPGTVPNLSAEPQSVIDDYFIFEETDAKGFEVGYKGNFFDNRLTGDITAYRYEYDDLQVAVFDSTTTTFSTQNAGVAIVWGLEGSGVFQATNELQLRVAASYSNLEFDDWKDAACHTAQAIGSGPPGCYIRPDGAPVQDLSGERYGGPPLQVNVGATYDTLLSAGWELELTGDVIYHNGGYETRRQPNTDIDARTVVNLSARLFQSAGPWEAALICSNCFDKIYVTSIQDKPLQKTIPGTGISDLTGQIAYPRLVTAQLTYRL